MKSITLSLICAVALAAASSASAQVVFSEDWDDGNGASRWSAPITALEDPGIGPDSNVDYAFDYSVLGAGSAPNSTGGTTVGVAFESNVTDNCPGDVNCEDSDEGEGVAIIPLAGLADIPAGDFSFKADAYLYWNFESGSTEYATMGVHSQGTASPLRFNLDNGDGLAWQFDSDGDSGTDILRYENPGSGETGLGGYEDIPDGNIPNVRTCDPGVDCAGNIAIGPQNQWVEMEIRRTGASVSISMNGYVLDSTTSSLSGGTIIIGGADAFNSVNIDNGAGLSNYQVFDNIELSIIPEPSSILLLCLGGCGLLARRR